MPSPRPPRAVADVALGLAVGFLALASSRMPDVDDRRGGWGRDGPGFGGPAGHDDLPPALGWSPLLPAALLVLALALRRTAPRLAHLGALTATAVFLLTGGPYGPVLLGPALAVHTLLTRFPPRQLVLLLLAVPVSLSAGFWNRPYAGLADPGLYLAVVLGTAGILLPGLITLVLTARRDAERQDVLAERRRYAYEERLQIAREVHDVVGHSLAVINMQAGVALHLLQKRPDQLGPSLEAIRSTSKTALAELGSTLATLRGDPGPATPVADRPEVEPPTGLAGLAGLDKLVAALQAAGRSVHYTRPAPDQLQLPVGVQHAALRIAQEGLTNVVRHAAADAAITVTVGREDQLLVVEVVDDGRHTRSRHVEGSGITGMRERARAVGGRVEVGALPGRGFRIRAELPAAGHPRASVATGGPVDAVRP